MYPSYPLERVCTHRQEPFQLRFARRALELLPQFPDRSYEATGKGLIIRGETELAVHRPTELLKSVFGDQVRIGALTIRYREGEVLQEPHMGVRVQCPAKFFEAVRADLLARGATLLDEELSATFGIVRCTAPLARLLGYSDALAKMTDGSAREVMWFSHYAPVEPPPPDRAA
jgi:translation elongation factor EF-G